VSAAAEVAALRGIARRLSQATGPIEPRQAHAWGSAIASCARNLAGAVEHLSAELAGREPAEPAPVPLGATGYEGLSVDDAAQRYASRATGLAVTGAPAADLLAERGRFVAAIAAIRPQAPSNGRGVAAGSPDANGTGRSRAGARDTSRQAALLALPASGRNRRRVLDAVVAVARNPSLVGLTDLQIAQATGLRDNSVRPRRVELVDGGWLEPATDGEGHPVTREHYGREHTVWVLTQKAAGARELWDPSVAAPAPA
jgi:hypothetical protein